MRDNERILEIIGGTEAGIRARIPELLEAGASAETIRTFADILQILSSTVRNLGERREVPSHHGVDRAEIAYAVGLAVAPMEARVAALSKRIEALLEEAENA